MEIEKTSEAPSKKLEFYIDNPGTGLKKIDFNIITNKDEMDDLNNDIRDHYNNDLTDDVYNNIDHDNEDQKRTTHNNLYTLADNKLQLRSDLKDLDWNSTDSHEGELIIAYYNKVGIKTLCLRAFYALYDKPNKESNGHLIYRLATDQIEFTKDYQTVPVPEDLDAMICETELYEKNIKSMILIQSNQ